MASRRHSNAILMHSFGGRHRGMTASSVKTSRSDSENPSDKPFALRAAGDVTSDDLMATPRPEPIFKLAACEFEIAATRLRGRDRPSSILRR
jgi:hypothetical protein